MRYILKLTSSQLIAKLLDMVYDGKIAFTIAVELSYLTEEQQYELYEVMDMPNPQQGAVALTN